MSDEEQAQATENIYQNQVQLVEGLSKIGVNIKKDPRERKSIDYFKRRLETLEAYWADYQYNNERLVKEVSKSHPYFTKGEYEKALNLYRQTKAFIHEQCQIFGKPIDEQPGVSGVQAEAKYQSSDHEDIYQLSSVAATRSKGSLSKLDEMLRRQASNFRAFHRTVTGINLEFITQKWELEDALRTLQARWTIIDTLHLELDSELEGMNDDYQTSFIKHEKTYNDLKKEINSKLWSVTHRESWTPKMDIPIFSGHYQNWVSFKDLFSEAIHSNISLSNAQKMQFLKGKLRGEAERLIQHLQISSDNYLTCWEILNNRYNNIRLIFSSHANALLNLPTAQQASVTQIKKIHDTTQECLNAIKNLGVDVNSWDPLIVHILLQKLDPESHNHYLESLENPKELPTLQDFLRFLETKFTTLESSRKKPDQLKPSSSNFKSNKPIPNNNYRQSFPANSLMQTYNDYPTKRTTCPLCQELHGIFFCNKFLNMSPQVKRKTISRLQLCKNCLYDHKDRECISEKRCKHCKGDHNTLLHEAYANTTCNLTIDNTVTQPAIFVTGAEVKHAHTSNINDNSPGEILLATAIIKVKASDGSYHQMRALVDQGSQTSLISENAAQILGLPRKRCKGVVSGIGAKESNCKGVITLTCLSLHSNYTFNTDALIMNTLIKNLPTHTFSKPSWYYLEGIQLADPEFYRSRPVDVLLGADVYSNIILDGISRSDQNLPVAQQTRLGWILCGNVQTLHCNVVINQVDELQRFWEIEDISEISQLSEEDQQAITYYNSTTVRREDGTYEVRIPFKDNYQEKLGSSKSSAIAQFRQLERKFEHNHEIEKQYKSFINEYQTLGHMIPSVGNQKLECYLPHHSVLRNDSTTTALRVVFDASRKTSSGYSLNDLMLRGPNLQRDLQTLLLTWRQFCFAFTADIEKMFRYIWINYEDQIYQKIIWRDTVEKSIKEYQLCTVTYGTKAAPFLAMMTLKQLAEEERSNFDFETIKALEESFYMDDLVYGAHSVESAKQLQQQLIKLLKSGGFNLRKWSSNAQDLLQNKSDNNILQENFYFNQTTEPTKTLGLRWNPNTDMFTFQPNHDSPTKVPTKRTMLSDISKLFDPLGLLSPLSTSLKIVFQKVWLSNIEWDDRLSNELIKEWISIRENLSKIDLIKIQRWLGTGEGGTIELHGFCDSSNKAYAGVVYCKTTNNGEVKISLVAGKARLVPANKTVSLPRLELSGALLLSKLMLKVQQSMKNYHIKLYGWSDSMVVLAWLQGEPGKWQPFVANRVRQISDIMPPNCWRYVKSGENPADCASRGMTADQLKEHSLWWNGPSWLLKFDAEKETEQSNFSTNEEAKKSKQLKHVHLVSMQSNTSIISELLSKYSSFTKLTRVLAWILRFIKQSKQKHKAGKSYLSLQEINEAKYIIIKHVQSTDFMEEINQLKLKASLPTKSRLLQLNPFLDDNDILRVGGRLCKANINEDMIHPMIIPHSGQLTNLIIDQVHLLTCHGGARVTSATIRQKFWIIGGNRAVKKRIRNCVTCRKHTPNKMTQLMGDLPSQRCNTAKPFYHTGVDFTGHVLIKPNKGRGVKTTKSYVAVFVCMVTKLVHLELVSDLTSSAFIAALRRMAARRGTPRHVYCDNGTNFVGASKIIQQEFEQIQQSFDQEFINEITNMEMEWHFNAPSWPSAGGLWEAAVKSLKYHLRRVIGDQKLTFEEFYTVLTQIEAVLNSRPLCPLTEDPNDLEYLTPSSFININQNMNVLETETDMRTRWYLTQKIVQDIWKRWRIEYLSQLTARSKWRDSQPCIKLNDIVTINDANLPPGKWAVGRVVELHPGADGHVRVVTLKTKGGLIKRPITKLSKLPINDTKNEQESTTINK